VSSRLLVIVTPSPVAMPSALHGGDGPSPAVHSPPAGLADQNALSQSLPTLAFILNQLSFLLTSLGSTANDAYTRQQLLGAMCNTLMVSLTLPYSPAPSIPAAAAAAPLPNSPAVSAAPAPSVASPVIEPPRPPTPPPRPTSSPPAPSTPPPGPAPILAIRVLTPIEQLRPPPLRSQTRRSSRKRRRARSCPSSPVSSSSRSASDTAVVATSNLYAPLAQLDSGVAEQASGEDVNIAHQPEVVSASSSSPSALPSLATSLSAPATPATAVEPPAVQQTAEPADTAAAMPVDSAPPCAPTAKTSAINTTSTTGTTTATSKTSATDTTTKRRCTRSATDADSLTLRFFSTLAGRPQEPREYFEKHFPPTTRMCHCQMYPVFSAKQHCDAKLPPEFDSLCLVCASRVCDDLGVKARAALLAWLPAAPAELRAVYLPLYTPKEEMQLCCAVSGKAAAAWEACAQECRGALKARLGIGKKSKGGEKKEKVEK